MNWKNARGPATSAAPCGSARTPRRSSAAAGCRRSMAAPPRSASATATATRSTPPTRTGSSSTACAFRGCRPTACCRRSSNTRIIRGSSAFSSTPNSNRARSSRTRCSPRSSRRRWCNRGWCNFCAQGSETRAEQGRWNVSDVPQTRPFVLPWKDSDDEVVVNVAIGSLRESMLAWLKTERGVHVETLLASIGALAGFAGQTAAFRRVETRDFPGADPRMATAAMAEHLRTANLMVVANTKSGESFYFGDLINGYVVPQPTNEYSLWNFVAAAAIEAGLDPAELPDCREMFQFIA